MKLYVIGPVSGLPLDNRPSFHRAKIQLESAGYEVEIPHDTIPHGTDWETAMKQSITRMLQADGVAMLNGFVYSHGAFIEYKLARDLGMDAKLAGWWIENVKEYL